MAIDIQERSFLLRSRRRRSLARLRHCLGIEARVRWAIEAVGCRTIVKEWGRRSAHCSDWKPPVATTRDQENANDGMEECDLTDDNDEGEYAKWRLFGRVRDQHDSRPGNAIGPDKVTCIGGDSAHLIRVTT